MTELERLEAELDEALEYVESLKHDPDGLWWYEDEAEWRNACRRADEAYERWWEEFERSEP